MSRVTAMAEKASNSTTDTGGNPAADVQHCDSAVTAVVLEKRSLYGDEYPWSWWEPCSNLWPMWLAGAGSSLLSSYWCGKMFKSGIRAYPGRVAAAVMLSVAASSWRTHASMNKWRRRRSEKGITAREGAVHGSFVFGPLCGFFGGAAVSQPTEAIRYKSNPAYFVSPVLRRYCVHPLGLSVMVASAVLYHQLFLERMRVDEEFVAKLRQSLRQSYMTNYAGEESEELV